MYMHSEQELRERVARGAALLDERRPGWHREIIPDQLDMISCEDCIIGQLFNGFNIRQLWPHVDVQDLNDRSALHGFDLCPTQAEVDAGLEHPWRRDSTEWKVLHDLWLEEIRRRV